jgi:hypothetical protein
MSAAMIGFFIGVVLGAPAGFIIAGLMQIAARADAAARIARRARIEPDPIDVETGV